MDREEFHPRPQLRRESILLLHEGWKLNGESIKVPFPPQSMVSGYRGSVPDSLSYSLTFTVPKSFQKKRILLHFDAVDQIAEVTLNGVVLGEHRGGYLPFCFDVTDQILTEGENRLSVLATDTLSHELPYGKQRKKRGGMWYTPVSGIWGCVWLENVPDIYVKSIKLIPDLKGADLELEWSGPASGFEIRLWMDEERNHSITKRFEENKGRIDLSNKIRRLEEEYWTPENPRLFYLTVRAGEDEFETYFALRTVEIREMDGVQRVLLNGKPVFLHGLLDQGYFPDGIFRPSDPKGYEQDVLLAKELGFNTLRKHIKIEPEEFYYACDKRGMLVIQDMVNSGVYSFFFDTFLPNFIFWMKSDRMNPKQDLHRKEFFISHMIQTIDHLRNHPCIIAYTIFNEGWGQFESDRLYTLAKKQDPTRLVDSTSGWFAQKLSDFDSKHIYFHSIRLRPKKRPLLLSECGGFSMEVPDHLFHSIRKHFGYGRCHDTEELTDAIAGMYAHMVLPAIKKGLCGCIYTQLTDVEEEINGLFTYDREVCKVDRGRIRALSRRIFGEL